MDKLKELENYIKNEIENERETMKEEPCNSHVGSMASGAHDAYVRIQEFLKELG